MPYDPSIHHRRSIRLKNYDYAQQGAYYVTICVNHRECLLGRVADTEIELTDAGRIVAQTWNTLPDRFLTVELDAFVIMPNHVHGILVINESERPGNASIAPTNASLDSAESVGAELALPKKQNPTEDRPTLGRVVQAFKSISAIACNRLLNRSGVPFWQRNYWEHVIRDDRDLARLREYIEHNPGTWIEDTLNPAGRNYFDGKKDEAS
jgi:putative transposase